MLLLARWSSAISANGVMQGRLASLVPRRDSTVRRVLRIFVCRGHANLMRAGGARGMRLFEVS